MPLKIATGIASATVISICNVDYYQVYFFLVIGLVGVKAKTSPELGIEEMFPSSLSKWPVIFHVRSANYRGN